MKTIKIQFFFTEIEREKSKILIFHVFFLNNDKCCRLYYANPSCCLRKSEGFYDFLIYKTIKIDCVL